MKAVFADADMVSKVRKAVAYLKFLTHVALVVAEVLLHRRIPIPLMDKSFHKIFQEEDK